MKITIHLTPQAEMEVDAEATNHPELAIHEMKVRELVTAGLAEADNSAPALGKQLGKVWTVSHIPSGQIVMFGLLTHDLAVATADMLTASGIKFGAGEPKPFLLDQFQAAASMLADLYFAAFYKTATGRLAAA